MASWNGTIYTSATLTDDGNSGFIDMEQCVGRPMASRDVMVIRQAYLRMVPENLATDETLDLDLNLAWDSTGSGDVKVHDFTQVTSTNAAEVLILPGGESVGNLVVNAGTDFYFGAVMPPYFKFVWTLGGSTKSMNFTVYGALRW